jgi:hypothetical protein
MAEREWQVERELIAGLQALAANIRSDLKTPGLPSMWARRREQIAEMRQRIKAQRARHRHTQPWAR